MIRASVLSTNNRAVVGDGGHLGTEASEIGRNEAANNAVIATAPWFALDERLRLVHRSFRLSNLLVISDGAAEWSSRGLMAISSSVSNNAALVTGPGVGVEQRRYYRGRIRQGLIG